MPLLREAMSGITQYRLKFDSRVECDDAMLSKITGWMRSASDTSTGWCASRVRNWCWTTTQRGATAFKNYSSQQSQANRN